MRPASTVVLPLPGPARTLSGPSPAVTTSRWLGEKSLRSTPGSQRWQLLGPASVTGQLLPPQQVAAIDQIEQFVGRALSGDAENKAVFMFAVVMTCEEFEWVGRVAENGQNSLDSRVGKDVVRGHPTRHCRCRVAPDVEIKLLDSGQTRAAWLPLSLGARVRFWRGGHGCSSELVVVVGLMTGGACSRR